MRTAIAAFFVCGAPWLCAQGSDLKLSDADWKRFLKTDSKAYIGRDIRVLLPAKLFVEPKLKKGGRAYFQTEQVLLVIGADCEDLRATRARNGDVVLRGRVVALPRRQDAQKDAPRVAIEIRELRRARAPRGPGRSRPRRDTPSATEATASREGAAAALCPSLQTPARF